MMENERAHLGAHVYRWSASDQVRLLRECVRPTAREAASRGLCRRFWYTLFDARGPHVLALFTPPVEAGGEERRRLEALVRERLGGWLAAHPSATPIDAAEAQRRHDACRGKRLTGVDSEPGLAANDSLVLFAHPFDGYPFRSAGGLPRAEELWQELDALSFWALDHLGDAAAAVRLTAAADRALSALGAPAASFWRHFAGTLLVPLRERLREEEERVVASLPAVIGRRNEEAFSRLWAAAPRPDDPPIAGAVRLVFADDGLVPERRLVLLREIVHLALAQLLVGVQARIPLVLYAWHRNLLAASAA